MENTILVALITSVASLIIAIYSSVNSSRSEKNIEKLKHNLELERKAIETRQKLNSDFYKALSASIKSVQEVKDVIQIIMNSCNTAHHSEIALHNYSEASKKIVSCYEEQLTSLLINDSHIEKDLLHRAKSLTLDLGTYLISALERKTYTSDLTADDREHLRNERQQLSDIQTKLERSIQDQLMNILLENYNDRR